MAIKQDALDVIGRTIIARLEVDVKAIYNSCTLCILITIMVLINVKFFN